eukprot:7386376-Prymnesium_polylepis.1
MRALRTFGARELSEFVSNGLLKRRWRRARQGEGGGPAGVGRVAALGVGRVAALGVPRSSLHR